MANDNGNLRDLLNLLCLGNLYSQLKLAESNPKRTGKIIIFGDINCKKNDLLSVAKSMGISDNRVEFVDYQRSQTYNYSVLEFNENICAILIGPIPHKTTGTQSFNSTITHLEQKVKDGIIQAPVLRLSTSNKLKVTLTNIRNAFQQLINEGSIVPALSH
jgi:hypothetical protein